MNPPPGPTYLVVGGLVWNFARSRRNRTRAELELPLKPTVSRWACRHKRAALTVAGGFCAWWLIHWALYVLDDLT
jgi:hypothetical protein